MRALSAVELRFWIAAVIAFALFFALGTFVSSRPPSGIDLAATALRGEATSLAAFFTALGRWYALVPIAAVAVAIAFATRAHPLAVVALFVSQSISQAVVSFVKPLFHRARPDHWLLYREGDLSFPSGHATTSVVFFFGLLWLVWRTPSLPKPLATTALAALAICVVGIPWSRLALGAHYATDVTGGLLFGTGWLCTTVALLYRFGAIA